MTDIFISYSRDDREIVSQMAASLAREGFNVWWDTEIPPGSTFSQVIDERLNEADCVLVVWSRSSVQSNWVQEEADDGLQNGRLIPVMIDPIELPRGFKRVQTADLTGWSGSGSAPEWRRVVGEIRRLVEQPGKGATSAKRASKARVGGKKKRNARGASSGQEKQASSAQQQPSPKKKSGAGLTIAAVLIAALFGGGYYAFGTDHGHQTVSSTLAGEPPRLGRSAAPKAGAVIQDCDDCPELVVVAPGKFALGAKDGEPSSEAAEKPQIKAEIAYPFAIGRYEVTFDEWAACVAGGGCNGYEPSDQGWGGEKRPVINVTFEQATAYLSWISEKTGRRYRLPSEAEWEYAARAGAETPFSFGESISTRQANFNGQYPYAGAQKERSVGKTLPVGSFSPNGFGIFDAHGNVWEMASDCWIDGHKSNPADGSSAGKGGGCAKHVLKGGAWNGGAWRTRSAHRKPAGIRQSDFDTGFRVVRELN